MNERLTVAIDGPELIDAPESYGATGPFVVHVDNEGRATHVHVAIDGPFEAINAAPDANHFVDSGESLELRFEPADRPVEGALTVAAGHGADEATIDVRVAKPKSRTPPHADESDRDDDGLPIDEELLVVAGIATVGILLAQRAFAMTGSLIVFFGALIVVGAAAAGTGVLLFER